jgi:acyl transferase domain-containing protein/thioesterase domain-containing protein
LKTQFLISINHPILKNHKVYDQELLPGLAYIDMLYQIFRDNNIDFTELELRNLSIYNPLTVGQDYAVMLSIECVELNERQWHIVVEGQEQRNGTLAMNKKRYITAEMHRAGKSMFEETLDLDEVKQSAQKIINLEELYEQCRRQELTHTEFMKAEGIIYDIGTAVLIDISLGKSALPGAGDAMFHPTLIDGSGVGSSVLFSSLVAAEHRLFLPFFYGSFRASALFQKNCITRIQASSIQRKKELVYQTMEFFDESGQKVAQLKNYANKLVRSSDLINPNRGENTKIITETRPNSRTVKKPKALVTGTSTETEFFLRQLLAERLKKPAEQIETQIGYYEMGLDSPGLLEVVKAIETRTKATLPPTLMFEYTTIEELAKYLDENYPSQLDRPGAIKHDSEPELLGDPVSSENQLLISSPPEISIYEAPSVYVFRQAEDEIAVIGMAGRYPEAENLEEFWLNLKAGKDCIREIPQSRWDPHLFDGWKSPSGKPISRWGGFIDNPDYFDPQFFRISPREAEWMDPQERLFLEICWESIENGGYTPKTLVAPAGPNKRQPVGVFVGVMHKDYTLVGAEALFHGQVFPLSLNCAPIANRVSYFCNFHGPSMAVDTVCSSSLTAVHLAMESIKRGECEVALAGGVNLSLHPGKYMSYGMGDMHSSDGYCRTFGKGGDGYVSGEGIGVVLLKPLSKAIKDRDHIYAVIKGSAINHVGTVSGITVPSPVAQADMITACLEKTGIHPRTISYVEAHGTGTSLGDPIEIQGLVKAYHQYTQDREFCAIGSVKSNIGHAESAAGISGLHKVILQLYNKTLVPSLHSEEVNPYIDFKQSPFYVQHQTEEWKQPLIIENGRKNTYPRRAGLSSFGASGSNAHIILEEYISEDIPQQPPAILDGEAKPVIIPLSAKNKERLQAYAGKLQKFLLSMSQDSEKHQAETKGKFQEINLSDLAFTLQVGREAMEERVAFLVKDIPELIVKIKTFIEGKSIDDNYWQGQVKHGKETIDLLSSDQDSLELIQKWITKNNLRKIAELWVKGYAIDWELFYREAKPQRISLPTYPFDRERYWVPQVDIKPRNTASLATAAYIHPLLHQNTSNLLEYRFSSTFTGGEFFLAGHDEKSRRILPAVAYLEMARAAVEQAAEPLAGGRTKIRLTNIVWYQLLTVGDQPVKVHIGLFPEENGEITYEIYGSSHISGASEGDGTGPIIYNQGTAVLTAFTKVPTLDLKDLQSQCTGKVFSGTDVYEAFQGSGIDYDSRQQGIEMIYVGQDQLLVKLSTFVATPDTQGQFVLHPGLASALQASIGFIDGLGEFKPSLPMELQELEIFDKGNSPMWILAQIRDSNQAGDKTHGSMQAGGYGPALKLDIDICDEQGTILARMKGYSSRILKGKAVLEPEKPLIALRTLMLQADWKEQTVTSEAKAPTDMQHLVILCEMDGVEASTQIRENIENGMHGVQCLILQSKQKSIAKRFQTYVTLVFDQIQNVFKNQLAGRVLVQIVIPNQGEAQLCSGLSGLLKTARLENPKFIGQLIEVDPDEDPKEIPAKLEENRRSPDNTEIRYRGGKRWVSGWGELITAEGPPIEEVKSIPWKDGGIYLITGGAGGLGFIFASEITRKAKNATIILAGRSPLGGSKQTQIKELEALGARIIYKQVDVVDKKSIDSLIQSIKNDFGGLHGIIHGAGVIRDNYIVKKTREEILEVLAPKVTGLVNLDTASKELNLDFFVLFSSIAGSIGGLGQADYSAANAFMDAYAGYRNALVASNQRQGKTLSINWPLWKEGGMRVDEATEKLMTQNSGLVPMATQTGIRTLYLGITSGKDQIMVLEGDLRQLAPILLGAQTGPEASKMIPSGGAPIHANAQNQARERRTEIKGLSLEQCLEWDLKGNINRLLKIPRDKINREKNLADFGFNSIGLTQLAIQLIKHYGIDGITPALFFKYSSIEKLIQYFLTEHQEVIRKFYLEEADMPVHMESATQPEAPVISMASKRRAPGSRARSSGFPVRDTSSSNLEPIAIIGMSGRFPNAGTVEELWNNLVNGKNCITEIPPQRWDWRNFYGDPHLETGKTNSKWGGFIADIDHFDPLFFEISPKEAELIDPRQRLFLEEAWRCFEDAGYMGEHIKGKSCGVYVGVEEGDYGLLGASGFISNNQNATLPARIAYKLDLKGPNLAIAAACSSGLAAIHQACQALHQGDCEIALAGGVNLLITPLIHIGLSQADMLSPEGKSYVFDQRANGMVPSEAVAVVLLKPLSKAISDKDHIYGCVKASGVNYNGKGNGITAPNPDSQAKLMKDIYDKHHIDPKYIQYIIPQSLGSKLGDPVEIEALTNAFGKYTDQKQYCAIGSIKPLIGHTFAASGVVSLISMVMAMQNRTILAMHNYESNNEYINFKASPFIPSLKNQKWEPTDNRPRMGAISTTGTNGTNAHTVIEEYLPPQAVQFPIHAVTSPLIMIFSGKTQDRLVAVVQQMLAFIERKRELSLSDVAYTLQVGREAMPFRLAMVIKNREELIHGLKAYLNSTNDNQAETLVPFYIGDLENDRSGINDLLSGKVEEMIVELLLKENNLEKIAHYWAKGGRIPWESLHEGEEVRRISLPTYPFEEHRCWVESGQESNVVAEWHQSLNNRDTTETHPGSTLPAKVVEIISHLLGLAPSELNLNKPLAQYGLDSIMFMQLLQQLQSQVDSSINLAGFQEYKTIQDIINSVRPQYRENPVLLRSESGRSTAVARLQFPELICLNQGTMGQPVFWFHGGLGGVESYQVIALKTQRPFYGIQARGWMTNYSPIYGIQAMASYYVQIIQSIQPVGPYDLGGYSLGGVLAYEITRQLQELGETVDTIVMLDSPSNINEAPVRNNRTLILQTINMALASVIKKPEELGKVLIHRDELNLNIEDETFIGELITLAKARGLTKTEIQINTMIQRNIKVVKSYQEHNFHILPLPNPLTVTCHYFRNKSGLLYGELEPYFLLKEDDCSFYNKNYWEGWQQQIPQFQLIDVDSSNHMWLLSEPKTYTIISAFCEELYSKKGMSM